MLAVELIGYSHYEHMLVVAAIETRRSVHTAAVRGTALPCYC